MLERKQKTKNKPKELSTIRRERPCLNVAEHQHPNTILIQLMRYNLDRICYFVWIHITYIFSLLRLHCFWTSSAEPETVFVSVLLSFSYPFRARKILRRELTFTHISIYVYCILKAATAGRECPKIRHRNKNAALNIHMFYFSVYLTFPANGSQCRCENKRRKVSLNEVILVWRLPNEWMNVY